MKKQAKKQKCEITDEELQEALDGLVEKGILVKFWNEDDQEWKYQDTESFEAQKNERTN